MPNIKVGDIVIAKNPWGIGPKDEETADGKKIKFHEISRYCCCCSWWNEEKRVKKGRENEHVL